MATSNAQRVLYRGGFSADWAVVSRLLALEQRGATFTLRDDGGFRVMPASVLTEDDRIFLRAHRAEARAVIAYQADDRHLFDDRPSDGRAVKPEAEPDHGGEQR
jgi:hypothetical protein